MTQYVVGFMHNESSVLLIEKRKLRRTDPASVGRVAGLINGIGGKIQNGETPLEAMRREFDEEAGIDISTWKRRGVMMFDDANVHVFAWRCQTIPAWQSKTDEIVSVYQIHALPGNIVPQLKWLIPLVMDDDFSGKFHTYHGNIAL